MSLPLRLLLIINAVAALAAGIVLFGFPAAIPSTVGIALPPEANFVAWLLGAAEIGIAALCAGAFLQRLEPTTEGRGGQSAGTLPEPSALRLAVLTLIIFHAASAVADLMALLQHPGAGLALNLAVRVLMVVLFALFGFRRAA